MKRRTVSVGLLIYTPLPIGGEVNSLVAFELHFPRLKIHVKFQLQHREVAKRFQMQTTVNKKRPVETTSLSNIH